MSQVRVAGICAKCAQACPQKYDNRRKFNASVYIACDETKRTEFINLISSISENGNKISMLIEEKAIVNLKILESNTENINEADIIMFCYEVGKEGEIQSLNREVNERKPKGVKVLVIINSDESVNESKTEINKEIINTINPSVELQTSLKSIDEVKDLLKKAIFSYLEEKRPYWKENSEDTGCLIA